MASFPLRLRLRHACATIALVALSAAGCAAPLMTTYLSGSRRDEVREAAEPMDPVVAANDPKAAALRKAMGQQPTTPEEALGSVLDELEAIDALDPAARKEVMADLKQAKPEHYGDIVEQFHAALAYRKQLAERQQRELVEEMQLATDAGDAQNAVAVTTANHQTVARPAVPAVLARPTQRTLPNQPAAPTPSVEVINLTPPPVESLATPQVTRTFGANALTAATADVAVQPASASAPLPAAGDWQSELNAAIADLEREVSPQPANVEELHAHLRLRALQLAAGREEDAYRPIPGASPAQQDYWSKQLFAMGAYLNNGATADDKKRAAATLVHLDDARAALAQIATLQLKNLSFVKRVDGYGAYEPLESARFEPNAAVTIYAEVENFASTSTAEGYETLLATSYQILDEGGRRIDGAQFPEVSDVCRGRRRDFHLQYGFTLPTRISPGKYQMRLTITDQRSGKIGSADLPLEINAER
jgi:fermentation-respiration switch protein FrsA (DUF1100 family)